jgi:hypothetical protein
MSWARFAALAALTSALAVAWLDERPRVAVRVACAADSLPRRCNLVFVESTNASFRGLAHVEFRVDYPKEKLDFGEPLACAAHPLQQGVTATFENDTNAGIFQATLSRPNGLFPYPLAVCAAAGAADAQEQALSITVAASRDTAGQDLDPPASVTLETFECVTTVSPSSTTVTETTTSTTLGETTTTTIGQDGLCGDADDNGSITASDALLTLRTAVGVATCAVSLCDVNADGVINTTDSLRILRKAVGIGGDLGCLA